MLLSFVIGYFQSFSCSELRACVVVLLLWILKYSGDAKSMESIESAYDKIMMEKLREYQKLQSNPIKKEVKELPAWMQKIVNMYQVPNKDVIVKRAAFYALLGIWSVLKPGDGGPAFQVGVSFSDSLIQVFYLFLEQPSSDDQCQKFRFTQYTRLPYFINY